MSSEIPGNPTTVLCPSQACNHYITQERFLSRECQCRKRKVVESFSTPSWRLAMKPRCASTEPITSAVCWFQWLTGMWERLCSNILLCVCSGQERRWTIGAQGPITEADRPNLWPPEERLSAEEGPCGLQLTRGPSSSCSLCLHWVLWWPQAYSPLLCWRPCFRPLWSPSDGGAPYTHHLAGVCCCGGQPRIH